MATANVLMSGGFSAGQADALNGACAVVSATGTTIADALGISGDVIVTGGAGGAGIRLPASAKIGDKIHAVNVSGQTLKFYPSSTSDSINELSAGAEISLATQKSCIFLRQSATKWRTIPLVPS